LRTLGFGRAVALDGGMKAWREQGCRSLNPRWYLRVA